MNRKEFLTETVGIWKEKNKDGLEYVSIIRNEWHNLNIGTTAKSNSTFKEFCGLWSEKDRQEFENATSDMESVNLGDWE